MRTLILAYPTQSDGDAPMEGKFLQLRLARRDFLLFAAATEYRYHNQILARFLSEQGIPHRWEDAENLVVDHPELAVTGGGRFRLDRVRQALRLWDESSVYGRFDPSQLAAQLLAAGPPWDRFALSCSEPESQ
ncbi:MAG: hypothetical protein U9Q81_07630 [Pseudomonadota bacterium]|nr:hypothetical protein [Pseudomonadota bacterium]